MLPTLCSDVWAAASVSQFRLPPCWARATSSSRVPSPTAMGPTKSRQDSTSWAGVRLPSPLTRRTMDWTPGKLVLENRSAAKLMRRTREPLSIHSAPVCHPSTLGGS